MSTKDKSSYNPAFVLASGPSLTLEDIERVKESKIFTVAVNNTWEKVKFCSILYAGDNCWWKHHGEKVEQAEDNGEINADRWTCSRPATRLWGAKYRDRRIKPGYNSGANALEVTAFLGFNPIVMLGFDCSVKNGIHHHGPHTKTGNPNPDRCEKWKRQFKSLVDLYPNVEFINCSRYTEIKSKIIKRNSLEEFLQLHDQNRLALP